MLFLLAACHSGSSHGSPFAPSTHATFTGPATAWVRVDRAGYAPGDPVQVLVFGQGSAPVPALDGVAATCGPPGTYAAAAGELAVARCTFDPVADGTHTVTATGADPVELEVGTDAYRLPLGLGLDFFAAQRCGPGSSVLHGPCHLFASVTDGDDHTSSGDGVRDDDGKRIDVEGGWHDAGDYVKFTHTTSFTVVLLLTTYLQHPSAWPDDDGDGVADLLATVEPAVRWLEKLHPDPDTFVYQVSTNEDHDHWRLPERDTEHPLPHMEQRPALLCGDKCANVAGRTAGALALAARVWKDLDPSWSAALLSEAKADLTYAIAHPGVQHTSPADFYPEDSSTDDLELAAAAIAAVNHDPGTLAKAVSYATDQGTDGPTPSYADAVLLADTILLPQLKSGDPALHDLDRRRASWRSEFADAVAADPTGWAGVGEWGSVAIAAGDATTCALLADADGDDTCADDARFQVHFARGANPFGIGFMSGLTPDGPAHIASPLPDLTGEIEVGAVVGGPANQRTMKSSGVELESKTDRFAAWQSTDSQYRDDVGDYVTNEAALDYTAHLLCATAAWGPR